MTFTLHVRNLRPLRDVRWTAEDVCCLVGPNGAGKTTLVLALKLLRVAFDRDLPTAVADVLGGSYRLRNALAAEDEPVEVGLDVGDLSWRVRLLTRGASVEPLAAETLTAAGQVILSRPNLSTTFEYRGQRLPGDERLALRSATDAHPEDPTLQPLVEVLRHIGIFYDPDLNGLRFNGSRQGMYRHLHSRAENVFAILRQWNERREHRARYEFVRAGMRAAFPLFFADLDFEAAGTTITMRVYRPGEEDPVPITHEANGVLAMLVYLTCVASGERGGVIAIDEPENALHPFAIRELLRRTRQWARQHEVAVIFTTHSPVLLNEFRQEPHRLLVMEPGDATQPVPVDRLRAPEWLSRFELGELYANNEFGSPIP